MMTIDVFGINLDVIAIVAYMFGMVVSTNLLKKIIRKKIIIRGDLIPLFLSWICGAVVFLILSLIYNYALSINTTVQFVLLTLLANGGFKFFKPLLNKTGNQK